MRLQRKRRFFVLEAGTLQWFQTESRSLPAYHKPEEYSFAVAACKVQRTADSVLEVTVPSRLDKVYTFECDEKRDAERWFIELSAAAAAKRNDGKLRGSRRSRKSGHERVSSGSGDGGGGGGGRDEYKKEKSLVDVADLKRKSKGSRLSAKKLMELESASGGGGGGGGGKSKGSGLRSSRRSARRVSREASLADFNKKHKSAGSKLRVVSRDFDSPSPPPTGATLGDAEMAALTAELDGLVVDPNRASFFLSTSDVAAAAAAPREGGGKSPRKSPRKKKGSKIHKRASSPPPANNV